MKDIIITLINKYGYFGILFLVAVENIFPPIPSEVILTFGGFLTTITKMNVFLVIVFSTLGSIIGAILLYLIGKLLDKERLIKISNSKLGKKLHLKKQDIEKADAWFDTKGQKTVFICRFVPIVRSLISIPAGMSDMSFSKFLAYTSLGTLIWNSVLVILGSILGDNWEKIVSIFNVYSNITLVALLILIILGVIYYKRKKKK